MTQAKAKMATTVPTSQSRTTPKDDSNASGPPVGLIVAPILLCVLIAALIFLWIKYREHKKRIQEQVVERMRRRNQGDSESLPSATTPGANSTHPSESESNKPLLSTSAYPSEEPVPSPGSGSESVVFTDEQSEKGQNLDPIEERDDNAGGRVRSVRPAPAAATAQRMLQEEHSESAEEQVDASESGGEQEEEEEPQSFRDRKYDSGFYSHRRRPYYRDMYGRNQHQLRPLQMDANSINDSDESEETELKQVVPSKYPPREANSGLHPPTLNVPRSDYQGSTYSDISEEETELKQVVPSKYPPRGAISDHSQTKTRMSAEPFIPPPKRPGQESSDQSDCETKLVNGNDEDADEEENEDGRGRIGDAAQEGKRLQNNAQEESEEEAFAKKYIV